MAPFVTVFGCAGSVKVTATGMLGINVSQQNTGSQCQSGLGIDLTSEFIDINCIVAMWVYYEIISHYFFDHQVAVPS